MSVIDQMSRLILADPNVTARQIAKTLGYAEEKSVYYWLSKSGYKGMRDFKKAVLSRSIPSAKRPEVPVTRDAPDTYLPLYTDPGQKALGYGLVDYLRENLGGESYAVLMTEDDCAPVAGQGDIVLVDPSAAAFQGDLQWASVRGRMRVLRIYGDADDRVLYVDAAEPGSVVTPDFVSGKVVFILRKES
ncbi:MAG: hypothetical protein ACM3WU_02020 [Bacillota bacterium]